MMCYMCLFPAPTPPSSPPPSSSSSHPFFLFPLLFLFFSLLFLLSFPPSLPPSSHQCRSAPPNIHCHSLDITSCTADIVTPVGVANQSITTVALDPTTNITYWAGSRESGVYCMNLEGNPSLPPYVPYVLLLPIHCLVLILSFHPFLLPHSVTLSLHMLHQHSCIF